MALARFHKEPFLTSRCSSLASVGLCLRDPLVDRGVVPVENSIWRCVRVVLDSLVGVLAVDANVDALSELRGFSKPKLRILKYCTPDRGGFFWAATIVAI